MRSDLFFYNTLSRIKEKFIPLDEKQIKMYVCGPTVYDDPHIGNARPLVVFDLLFRLLKKKFGNNNVTYVRNITDIDDKIIDRASGLNIPIDDLTQRVTKNFLADCKYLNCLDPSLQPKATEHIKEMISIIEKLINKNFAYEKEKHVYFAVDKFSDYGKLSNKKIDELSSGARIEVSDLKKNPLDFVLWKPSKNKEPSWDSPWGKGRPGWHIECSAMSEKYLGKNFDIHGGGLDLIFPHHENEIAQSQCANNIKFFSKFWMHNGFVTIKDKKMAKSEGNFISINQLKKKYNGQVVRLALLSSHYRQPLNWSDDLLNNSKNILDSWYAHYEIDFDEPKEDEILSLYDDLNTPDLISKIHDFAKKANKGDSNSKKKLNSVLKFIGLFSEDLKKYLVFKESSSTISKEEVEELIQKRNLARKNNDFKKADQIRKKLESKGIELKDLKETTSWHYK